MITTTPFGGVVLGVLDEEAESIPDGCFVYGDGFGVEYVVFGPSIVQQMRDSCPICEAGGVHAS
jgi:hypothetical protein